MFSSFENSQSFQINEELDEVFVARHKMGAYKVVPHEKKLILLEEFQKVDNFSNSSIFDIIRILWQKKKISK